MTAEVRKSKYYTKVENNQDPNKMFLWVFLNTNNVGKKCFYTLYPYLVGINLLC